MDKVVTEMTSFNKDLQQYVTGFAWGEIWARPRLTKKIKSLITVAMLVSLNRPAELRAHIRGAINNGCTESDIKEALLHSAVYCGFPAAIDGFRNAQQVFQESTRRRPRSRKAAKA
ncbi:MAG: carboxymuconolactone decarboxylase family protein [Anaerolineales bacterium]|nr:carboxymuconolactone decarboxylase family protein [Anaerolineales bacterium]